MNIMKTTFEIIYQSNFKRLIGEYPLKNPIEGPALLISAGIHGNEIAGILALNRIFKKLESEKIPLKGRVIGVTGNLKALKKGVRYIDKDLNRIFTPRNAARLRNSFSYANEEESEFKELLNITDSIRGNPLFTDLKFIDIHTTSSTTTPYISVNKRKSNYNFAKRFELPVVKGIEEFIPGHFDHYLSTLGYEGFTLEAGQHEDEISVLNCEAIIWLALEQAGLLNSNDNIYAKESREILKSAISNTGNYEVFYRYNILEDEEFKMNKGFNDFQKIDKGELIAYSNGIPMVAQEDAYMFLPLYQKQGSDGFFLIRPCE